MLEKVRFKRVLALRLFSQRIRILYYKMISENRYCGNSPKLLQPVLFTGNGKIFFEPNIRLGYTDSPFFYNGYIYFDARGEEAEIRIGENTWINNNAWLIADNARIRIGKDVLIGPSFVAVTSDFHNLGPHKRLSTAYPKMDVSIDDNVFIGANVTVLKGVTIGRNSVIGSGSIVTRSISENVVAAGIPCRVLKKVIF